LGGRAVLRPDSAHNAVRADSPPLWARPSASQLWLVHALGGLSHAAPTIATPERSGEPRRMVAWSSSDKTALLTESARGVAKIDKKLRIAVWARYADARRDPGQ